MEEVNEHAYPHGERAGESAVRAFPHAGSRRIGLGACYRALFSSGQFVRETAGNLRIFRRSEIGAAALSELLRRYRAAERGAGEPGIRVVKRTSSRVVAFVEPPGGEPRLVCKEYRYSPLQRVRKAFWYHRAMQAWLGTTCYEMNGLSAPRIEALIEERRWGLARSALLIYRHEEGMPLYDFLRERYGASPLPAPLHREKRSLLRGLAVDLAAQHSAGIHNRDLKAENVVVRIDEEGEPRWSYLDLEGVSVPPVLLPVFRANPLAQLASSVAEPVRVTDRLCFVKAYMGEAWRDRDRRRAFIRRVMRIAVAREHIWP